MEGIELEATAPAPQAVIDSSAARAVARGVAAAAFAWLSFAAMTVLAVWNESRPGVAVSDPILAVTPYVPWIDHWNYWIWVVLYLAGIAVFLVLKPSMFVRLMIASGLASLLRGVCIVATCLAPVRGPDVNAALAWDWPLRGRVILQILNPFSVFIDDAAHIWLTKDLFFSGHTSSTALLVLFAWPMKRMRWAFLAAHLVVVASVLLGHIHYAIDVVGGWLAAIVVYCAVRPR